MPYDEELSTTPCPHCGGATRIGAIVCGAAECTEAEGIRRRQRAEVRALGPTLRDLERSLAGRSIHIFCVAGIWRAVISVVGHSNGATGRGLSVEDAVFKALAEAARKAVA